MKVFRNLVLSALVVVPAWLVASTVDAGGVTPAAQPTAQAEQKKDASPETKMDCPMKESGTSCCRRGHGQATGGQGMRHGQGNASGPGPGMGQGMGNGHRHGMNGAAGMGRGPQMGGHHETIHSLMADHKAVSRKVEEIPNGVVTVTTSDDPEVARTIRVHTAEMKERLTSGQPIRMFDPLFQEIFRNHEKIEMKIEEIAGGVKVTETSSDPKVVALIRQHAKVVSEFTAQGMARMHERSPLPESYEGEEKK